MVREIAKEEYTLFPALSFLIPLSQHFIRRRKVVS